MEFNVPDAATHLGLFVDETDQLPPTRIRGGTSRIREILNEAADRGHVAPSGTADAHSVLDLLDDTGDIISDYAVPTADAHQWWANKIIDA